jgi:hypothetical protein
MATEQETICVPFPKPRSLKISLPFGDLKSVSDISKGPPTDCTLIHGLMLQLSPALVSMQCLLNILNFLKVIAEIKGPNDLAKIADAAKGLKDCFEVFIKIPMMIVDILKVIIAYLKCILEAVRSILAFQVGINLGDAEGNPAVSISLDCAQNNAAASTAQLVETLKAIEPLLNILDSVKPLATSPVPGPAQDAINVIPNVVEALKTILAGDSATVGVPETQNTIQTLDDLKNTLEKLQDSLDALG